MIKTVFKSIGQLLLILLITFFLAEISLRIYHYFNPLFIFYDNSYNRFRLKPSTNIFGFKLNSKGFKDVEYSQDKGENFRILGIGDSFAFGIGPYQYHYLTLLEDKINTGKPAVEIINMGIPSLGPEDYLSIIVREGLELNPDMIILSFFIGNDFTDNTKTLKKKRKLYSYSFVTSFFHYLIKIQPRFKAGGKDTINDYCDTCQSFNYPDYLKVEYHRSLIYQRNNAGTNDLFSHALSFLTQIRDICEKKGIKLVVVLIPDEMQINSKLLQEVKKEFYAPDMVLNPDYPNQVLQAMLQEQNIDFIDLKADFVRASLQQTLYKPNDTHWNIAGNKLAADLIYNRIYKEIEK